MPRRLDQRRVALLHGPYSIPSLCPGDHAHDERFGRVEIGSLRDCPLGVWPVIRRKGRAIFLGGDLVRAVRSESNAAVAYWWRVDLNVVTRWRKALDVPETNEGTRALRVDRTPTQIQAEESVAKSERSRKTTRHRQLRRRRAAEQGFGGRPEVAIDAGRLRSAREAAGLTPSRLAEKAGVHVSRVNQIERGAGGPTVRPETLQKLADALGVDASALRPIGTQDASHS